MTEQEKINADVQTKLALQDAKFNMFMEEMREFKTEMRDRDNQRAAEIVELRQRQDADRKALEDKIDRLGDKIQNMVIAAVVGFGAIVFAAVSTLK